MDKKRWFLWCLFIMVTGLALCLSWDAAAEEVKIFPTTINNYMKEHEDACFFCPVFEGIYDAINTLVKTLYNNLGKWFLGLMGVGILFLLIFKVGKMLVQLQDVDLMQFLNDLFKPLGRAIIATALLGVTVMANQETIFYLLTNPFMTVSMQIGEEILDTSLGEVKTLRTTSGTATPSESKLGKIDWSSINNEFAQENKNAPDTALGEANKKLMVAWMKKVSSSFTVGRAMGWTFMKIGISGNNFFSKGLPVAIAGFTLWVGFCAIYFFFPIHLLNAFMRIAFVLALMPLWIILWVFPVTQSYTKKAWEMFLSSCLIFVALSVMVALALILVDHVVPERLMNSETGEYKNRADFFNMLIAGQDEEAKKYTTFGSGLILNCIAFTFMGWVLMGKAETLANTFIGGGGNVQLNIGNQTAATLAKEGKVVWSGAKMAGNVGLWAGKKIGGRILKSAKGRFKGSPQSGAGNGSGGGNSGGGNSDGGGNIPPPPTQNPTVIPGERGERGDRGPQGERGPEGQRTDSQRGSNNPLMPVATNVREAITPPDVAQPTARSVAADRRQETTTGTGRPNQSTATMGASHQAQPSSAQAILATLSPERLRAVQDLAKKGGQVPQLQKLSQDVAFIENSLGMKQGDFERAMKERTWLTDGKRMQNFANDLYAYKDKPTLTEVATNRMLRNTYLTSAATMDGASQIAKQTAPKMAQRVPNVLSRELDSLANQVSAAETVRLLPQS
ncbi:MAG: type IV secretion system protein [Pseudomonadota bacterium]|nr:type IV secretion system protein [Pseudomonadota bacterium]